LKAGREPVGTGQAGGAARRTRGRMAATPRARSYAGQSVGAMNGWQRGGRPGRPVRLGRKGGVGPFKVKMIFFQFLFSPKFIQMNF